MTPSDTALIARIAAGENDALGEFMDAHAAPLMRFATHFLGSAADADDVLQEVFLRAERAIRRGVRPERTESWLFTITVNRCRSHRRRWWPFVTGAGADAVIDATPASARDHDGMLWREEIDRALLRLTASLREAFLLKHVEGLDYQAMSEATGASVPALKMRVARACEQLRTLLAEAR